MIMIIAVVAVEVISLSILSNILKEEISSVLLRIFRNKKFTIYAMSLLFLPGTFFHELSHYIMALLLQVPVGEFEVIPKIENNYVRMGSVSIAKTDFIRNFLISSAPFFLGIIVLTIILYLSLVIKPLEFWWQYALLIYIIFEVVNSMFLSSSDLAGTYKVVAFIIFIHLVIIFYKPEILSVYKNLLSNELINSTVQRTTELLVIPVVINSIALGAVKLINSL